MARPRRCRRLAATAALAWVAMSCTNTTTPTQDPEPAVSSAPSSEPSLSVSPTSSVAPILEPAPDPVPARMPRGISAITDSGDVVLIDLETLTPRTIASFPSALPGDPDFVVASFLTEVVVVPDGRILISSCCEPAAGYIRVLDDRGREAHQPLYGDSPEVDPTGTRLAMTYLQSLSIVPATLRRGDSSSIEGRGRYSPSDPGWAPGGDQLLFSLFRRIGLVDAAAANFRDAAFLEAPQGTYWGATAYLRSGPLAVEIDGNPSQEDGAPSRIVRVDFATGRRRVVVSSTEAITDLATDRAAESLLWVEGGTIHWRVNGDVGSLAGEYQKAAFFPG